MRRDRETEEAVTDKTINAAGRLIGRGQPCFIIAEAGSNHDRNLKTALALIDAAAEAKADAIKFQTYSAETLYSKYTPMHSSSKLKPWDLIKSVELPREWQPKLAKHAEKKGIMFFSTPFDLAAVDELEALGVPMHKVASMELPDLVLVEKVARTGKPVIISTGGAVLEEIEQAVAVCRKAGNDKLVLLQCTTSYPAAAKYLNLRAMATLEAAFGLPAGFSDHSLGVHMAAAAAALGACVIEKHYTMSRKSKGPDHPFAIEPDELAKLVSDVREVEAALGDGLKTGPAAPEMENYAIAHRTIHAAKPIKKGARITRDMLCVKRPGLGIAPKHMDLLVGRRAAADIGEDRWIKWDMVD
jgi:N,N'-diacetyllegionaminate synthase